MKRIVLIMFMCLFAYCANAEDPIKWSFRVKKISAKIYELHLTGNLEKGWHIYSQFIPFGGPMPTTITFEKNPLLIIKEGKLKEIGESEEKYDSTFDVVVRYYHNKIDFVKLIELNAAEKTIIKGTIRYMGCNEEMCLPPQFQEFKVILN